MAKQNRYKNELKNRIFDRMELLRFPELTGGYDWKTIYLAVERIEKMGGANDSEIDRAIKYYYRNI